MTAKVQRIYSTDSPTMITSPALSSTSSSIASSDSPVFSAQSIHNASNTATFNRIKQQDQQQEQHFSNKRNFDCMNDSNSMMSHDDDDRSLNSEDSRGKKPGRKPMTEEEFDDDDEDPKIKRKAQNRAAQRAFRERKERYVKELEQKIKYVQDSHMYATTQLFQENQHLRSIIYRLEMELANFKGAPPGSSGNKSWLTSLGPPPNLNYLQAVTPHPQSYAPLQIRPSPVVMNKPRKIVPHLPEQSKKQKMHPEPDSDITSVHKIDTNKSLSNNTTTPSSPVPSDRNTSSTENTGGQQFTFSITTPATLRASSNNELVRKNEQIQVVQLYPDHSHPANCLLENKRDQLQKQVNTPVLSPSSQYNSSNIAGSVVSYSSSSDEEEKTVRTEQEFNDMLQPFFDSPADFDFTSFNNNQNQQQQQQQDTSSTPSYILNQLLEEANNNNSWNLMNNTSY